LTAVIGSTAYVEALRREGDALAAAASGGLAGAVAGCPGWTVAEVVRHTGEVHRFWQQVADRRLRDPSEVVRGTAPPDAELVGWFRDGLALLAATLETTDPATPVWTWSSQQDVAFIQRRMAQETAVHRWDAESGGGSVRPIATDLAVDGVDEFLDVMLPGEPEALAGPSESVHLQATDAPAQWLVTAGEGRLEVERSPGSGAVGEAAVTVSGTASDLLLLLWRRVSSEALKVGGDPEALQRFLRRTELE
jgi:uncharacterized protein (TIGR03083 family)